MNCPFCNINDIKTRILEEKNHIRVVLSNPRLMPGHLLVIPKRHVEKLSELNEKELHELIQTTIEYEEKILSTIAKGCDIRSNYRPFMQNSKLKVAHLHIHLQPREFKDVLYEKSQIFETQIFQDLKNNEINKISELLK